MPFSALLRYYCEPNRGRRRPRSPGRVVGFTGIARTSARRASVFSAPHRSGPRRPCRTTTTVPDDLSPFLFAKQIVKADGATLGPFEETVAQVRAARSPDGGDASFSRVSHQHARVKKPNICAPGGECGRKSRAIRDRAWTRAGRHTGYQASPRVGFCGVFQVSTGGVVAQPSPSSNNHPCAHELTFASLSFL